MLFIRSVLVLAAAAAGSFVSAITLSTPAASYPGTVIYESWTYGVEDPTSFTLVLVNSDERNEYSLVENVSTSEGHVHFTMPDVLPSSTYVLEAVNDTYAYSLNCQDIR
ncbi:predicted protein [Postia placenta Mad-698-R]|nr:predicted protein [Postia placenta Mad-698-R]